MKMKIEGHIYHAFALTPSIIIACGKVTVISCSFLWFGFVLTFYKRERGYWSGRWMMFW